MDLLILDYWFTTWTIIDITDWIALLVCGLQLPYYHYDGVSVEITVCFMIVFGKQIASKLVMLELFRLTINPRPPIGASLLPVLHDAHCDK